MSLLLRHPGREFHVCELIASLLEPRAAAAVAGNAYRKGIESRLRTVRFEAGDDFILDARAKAEYARQLRELHEEVEEAQRFDDLERGSRVQWEINFLAEQLARAVGLGGRDRRAGSQAERARSTVTKRLKDSIQKIAVAIPLLGRHLRARVKTGYYCSYNPHPDRPVKWKF